MAQRLRIIRIPRTPATAFDKHRAISDLVRNQVRHAYQELHDWWKTIGGVDPDRLETEQQAADYLRTVTRILHPEGVRTGLPKERAPRSGVVLDAGARGTGRARARKTGRKGR